MFNKLLSNLPYNPNLRSDILFYSARLRQENGIRLAGFAFLFLAALIQVTAMSYHPSKIYADDPSLNGLTPATYMKCSITATLLPGSTSDIRTTTLAYGGTTTPSSYHYDLDADGTVDAVDNTSENPHAHNFSNLAVGTHTVLVNILLYSGPPYNGIFHYTTCQTSITINPPGQAKIEMSKSVSDTTQAMSDANGQLAKAGDELVFKMTTKNTGTADFKNYTGRDDFSSVLQYADIESQSQLKQQGIVLDNNNFLNWTTLDLKAGSTDVKTVNVKVKTALPVKTSDNCQITNTYGNGVAVNVGCPSPSPTPEPGPTPSQTINQAATSLPNTGPGSTALIAFVVATAAGYFWSRSRLMAKEMEIAAHDDELVGGQV